MKQKIPFSAGKRRPKRDFLLHLGSVEDRLSHLISIILKKLLAPARGIAYINNPQADMAQLVEHNLAKVGVAGSSPVVRSIAFPDRLGGPFSAKWPSGKAEACKAFTPGSNPGFASRSPKGPSFPEGPFSLKGARIRTASAARPRAIRGHRRRQRRVSRGRPVRVRVLFQMKQKVPFSTGERWSKWDFLLHLGAEPLLRVRFLGRFFGTAALDKNIICRLCINCTFLYICGLFIHC